MTFFPASLLPEFQSQVWDLSALTPTLLSGAEVEAYSQGHITQAEAFNPRTDIPKKDGLFCPDLFGLPSSNDLPWLEAHQNRISKRYQKHEIEDPHPHNTNMGHIRLAYPIIHPWFLPNASDYLSNQTQLDSSVIHDLITFKKGVVSDSSSFDIKSAHDLYESQEETDKVRILWGTQGLLELLNQANASTSMIMDTLFVLPPDLRPTSKVMAKESLNKRYSQVINRNHRLSRLLDLKAPQVIMHNEKRMLQESVALLFDRRFTESPSQSSASLESLHRSLEDLLTQSNLNDIMDQLEYALAGQEDECQVPLPHPLFRLVRYLRAMGVQLLNHSNSTSNSSMSSMPSLEA